MPLNILLNLFSNQYLYHISFKSLFQCHAFTYNGHLRKKEQKGLDEATTGRIGGSSHSPANTARERHVIRVCRTYASWLILEVVPGPSFATYSQELQTEIAGKLVQDEWHRLCDKFCTCPSSNLPSI